MESEARNEADPEGDGVDRRPITRIRWFSFGAWVCFASWFALRHEWDALLGLTCTGVVVMINFLWLEELAIKLLGPVPQVKPWKLGARALMRYALFGLMAAVFVVRFNIISVVLGTSILVIGITGEALFELLTYDDRLDG
jgi:hypothetical protein